MPFLDFEGQSGSLAIGRSKGRTLRAARGEAKKSASGKLRHKFDRSLPKCTLLSSWVQHGHLAVVLTWRKLTERNAEAERHRFQPIVQPARHLNRLRFKSFRLRSVETHKSDQRSNTFVSGTSCRTI